MTHARNATLAILVLTSGLAAQFSIGTPGSAGCQGFGANPALDNGALASGSIDFAYDASNGQLTLTVDNTSPVTQGEATARLTRIYFNTPRGAVTGASLISATAAGGIAPDFGLSFVVDTTVRTNSNRANCFGTFSGFLEPARHYSGIANSSATTVAAPPGSWSVGPVVFEIQLSGPGTGSLTATTIANQLAYGASNGDTNVAFKFQGGGPGGDGSGVFANRPGDCSLGIYSIGPARIGASIEICRTGQTGCHDCLWITDESPVTPFTLPAPINLTVPFLPQVILTGTEFSTTHQSCATFDIPNNAALVGETFSFATFSFAPGAMTFEGIEFSEVLSIPILP